MTIRSTVPRAAALALAALAAACTRAPAAEPQPAAASTLPPVTIRFSDPGNGGGMGALGVLAYAKRERILERELAKANAQIVWVPGPQAFSANFDAMNSGAINASGGAISPIVGALAHNLRFRIFGIADPDAQRHCGVIVPAGSPIKSVADLVGKRVAVNGAAHGDYILLKALEKAGVPAARVQRVPIQPPDAAAAFATGKIDAWSTFGVFFSSAVRNGARVIALEADVASEDVHVNAASIDVLDKNPVAFKLLLDVINRLVADAHANPEKYQNVFTDKGPTALAGDELRLSIEETRTVPPLRVPTAADKARVARVAKLFFDNKSIDRPIDADAIVFDLDTAAKAKGLSL
jgi:sulfonate transport system substrate-binding protein